ncbi:MAG: T9SS type A sorting domain-containing protein [Bacteroidota bacterium]|nr:T9SS type A sorting domain-containing protein [Bacteroidota bacterium]
MKKTIYLIFAFVLSSQFIFGQCFPDRHSTNFFDGWVSCETAISPNPERGKSHFIMYDFNSVFALGQMTIWNSNDPSHLNWGMRDVHIDYSTDGVVWTTAGTYTFPQASGLSTYEGAEGPNLNQAEGRYLLITAINNYGGECFGLSEMRVAGEEVIISEVDEVETLSCVDISMYPNPFADKMTLSLAPGCTGDLRYVIYDAIGKEMYAETASLTSGKNSTHEIGQSLPSGSYMLHIQFGGQSIQRSMIKVNRS